MNFVELVCLDAVFGLSSRKDCRVEKINFERIVTVRDAKRDDQPTAKVLPSHLYKLES